MAEIKGKWVVKNFMRMHEEGYCIREIAEAAGVSVSTVYSLLGTIAERHGLEREELLDGTKGKKAGGAINKELEVAKTSPESSSIDEIFDKLEKDLFELSESVNALIAQE